MLVFILLDVNSLFPFPQKQTESLNNDTLLIRLLPWQARKQNTNKQIDFKTKLYMYNTIGDDTLASI